jgi:hypothetical protein
MLEAMFRDAFDRTTTSGLGTADDGTVYSAVGGDDYAHVDGSKVVQTSSSQSRYSGMPRVATGAVQFDFFTTSSRSDPNLAYQVDGGWELQNPGHYYHLFGTAISNGDNTWTIGCFGHLFSITVVASTWYRVRVEYDGTTERVKVWKRDVDPEPSTWNASGTTTQFGGSLLITSSGTPMIKITGPSSTSRSAQIDNVVIWDTFAAALAFSDDFNRTVDPGLGGNWVYTTDDSSQPSPGVMSVDGDVAHVPAGEFESQTNPDIPYAAEGYVRWDFLVPADTTDTVQMGVNFPAGTFYVGNPNGTSHVSRAWRDNTTGAYVEFYPDGSDWWTVWFWFGSGTDYVKIWPRDAPGEEPVWTPLPNTAGVPGTPDYSTFVLDVYYAPVAEDQLFDNMFVWASGPTTTTGSFTLAAEIARRSFDLRAIVKDTPRGQFDLEAAVARGWHFDAWVIPNRRFDLGAIVRRAMAGSFGLDAEAALTAPTVFLLDAMVGVRHPGSFLLKAWVVPIPSQAGSFDLAAFVVGTLGSFGLDAQVSSPASHADAFSLDAEVSATYRWSGFSVAAVALVAQSGVFDLEAIVAAASTPRSGSFGLSARAAGRLLLEAFVGYSFKLAAEVRNPAQEFGLDAWIGRTGFGWFAFDAVVANGAFTLNAIVKATRGDIIPFIASVIRRTAQSFGLDAHVAGAFTFDAYVQPTFRLSAEVADNSGQRYWPPGSGGPGNPPPIDAGSGDPWRPPHHQVRIQILIDDVDVTKDVELAGCNFTQAAGNNPGTFSLPMKGVFKKYDGGEEVVVKVDGFRQFGGLVVIANHGYHYPYVAGEEGDIDHPNTQPITVLQGTDFNVLFDRVVIYNVPWVTAHGLQGDYEPIDPLPADHSDRFYIQTIFAKYIDTVWRKQFGYNTYVEEATVHPSPETPFTVETGQTLRQFLAALSQMTNQIWYFDPYYELHSHSRANANAPRAITDGTGDESGGDPTGGIHCRDLTVVWSIADMADDTMVYGTLAETVEGEIIFNRRQDDENIAKFGLWQYAEVRSDLHLRAHVNQRGYALQVRSNRRVHRAQCRIFEKGFQAGQIVSLFSGEYGVAENIPITQLVMTFLVSQGAENGKFFGVPAYDLTMGNEPDPPWNLYDALPWQSHDYSFSPSSPNFGWRMPHLQLRNDGPGPQVAPCRGDGWLTIWASGCAVQVIGATATRTFITNPLSPPPWCVVFRMPANHAGFSLTQRMLDADDSGYNGQASFSAGFALIGSDWTLTAGSSGQVPDIGGSSQVTVPFVASKESYARVQVLQDGTVNARVWQGSEPSAWQAVAHPDPPADLLPLFMGGLAPSSRVQVSANVAAEFAVAGQPGWGWVWFYPVRTDPFQVFEKLFSPYLPATWGTVFRPGGTRPYEVPGDGGNTLDAVAIPNFPRDDSWDIFPRSAMQDLHANEQVMHRLVWGFSWVPSNGTGDANDPRMVTDQHSYVGFLAPPGAKRVILEATAYPNVYETGLFSIGSQPGPTGEGAIQFEVWRSDYRGADPRPDPNHTVIYSGTAPDYNYKDGDGSPIRYAYPIHAEFDIAGGEIFQIGGKITNSWDEIMHAHHEGELLVNGLKRVIELKITDIRLRFDWDPVPCEGDDVLGDCVDATDDPYWETGWGQEMTAADKGSGAFVARLPVAPATLSVYRHGKLLIPGDDYTTDGDEDHRNYHLVTPGARCLRLVYLASTATVTTDPQQRDSGTGNKLPDRTTQPDTRGIGQ